MPPWCTSCTPRGPGRVAVRIANPVCKSRAVPGESELNCRHACDPDLVPQPTPGARLWWSASFSQSQRRRAARTRSVKRCMPRGEASAPGQPELDPPFQVARATATSGLRTPGPSRFLSIISESAEVRTRRRAHACWDNVYTFCGMYVLDTRFGLAAACWVEGCNSGMARAVVSSSDS